MPGVMIIEALAQAAGILAFVTAGVVPDDDTRFYFVGIDKARFRKPVEPGDQLILTATARAALGHLEVLHRRPRGRRRGGARGNDGGARDRQDRQGVRSVSIDPRAIVSPKAELAADVTVGPFSVIGAGRAASAPGTSSVRTR